jgi:phage-related baseplate assembly protein
MIDLSQLPAPKMIETLSYEAEYQAILDLWTGKGYSAPLLPDPVAKFFEVLATTVMNQKAKLNGACKANLLAYAEKSDLDQLGAIYKQPRLLVTPADNTVFPAIEAVYQTDDEYRKALTLSFEGYTNAGSRGAYEYHALQADGAIKDIKINRVPNAGIVQVVVLSKTGSGVPSAPLLTAVTNALNPDNVRPISDTVNVLPATIVNYTVNAVLYIKDGASSAVVQENALDSINAFVASNHVIGKRLSYLNVASALKVDGVERVSISSPTADVVCSNTQAPYCTTITLTTQLEVEN